MTTETPVPTRTYVWTAVLVSLFGAGALWVSWAMFADGLPLLGGTVGAIAVFLLLVYLRPHFSAMRWMAIGIAVTALFAVYPIFFNIYIGFTNMGNGHLLTKEQAIERLEAEQYLSEDAGTYAWKAYKTEESYALLLVGEDGSARFATEGAVEDIELASPDEVPAVVGEYTLMPQNQVVPNIDALAAIEFGEPPTTVRIQSIRTAAATSPRYEYLPEEDAMVDLTNGTVYPAVEGAFTNDEGEELVPGFMVYIGLDNFVRFLTNEGIRNPLVEVLIWSFVFALSSVALSFIVGLGVAVLFDDLPGRRWIRALLIVPYPIPVLVSVLIWRSMLNPDLGTIGRFLERTFGESPQFFLDPTWTRMALILVNVWLSYPYFYVVTSGALRSIPGEMVDAAEVDGASSWQRFRFITLPQLLVIVMPLLIASFSFNFNNFNLIYVFNMGNPPMAETVIPIGHTDILISFIYKLAFTSSSTSDYGLGAAISVILFVVVGSITFFQIRATRAVEA
jgi:arabinogalactan oligomer / maltooligosaccharide transport system permease protein